MSQLILHFSTAIQSTREISKIGVIEEKQKQTIDESTDVDVWCVRSNLLLFDGIQIIQARSSVMQDSVRAMCEE